MIEEIPVVALRTGYNVLVPFVWGGVEEVWMTAKEAPRLNEGVTAPDRQIHVRVHEVDDPDACWLWGPSALDTVQVVKPNNQNGKVPA